MADIDQQVDLQPLRRLDRQIKATGEAVKLIGAESAINGWFQQLTALPEFVGFDPFAATIEWPAQVNSAMVQPAARAASRTEAQSAAINGNPTGFVDRLSEQSRRRSRLKLLGSETSAPKVNLQSLAPAITVQTRPMRVAEESGQQEDPVAPTTFPVAHENSGAWLALLEIDALVSTLESIDSTNQQANAAQSALQTDLVTTPALTPLQPVASAATEKKSASETAEQAAESLFTAIVSQLWEQQTVKMVADNPVERTEQQSAHSTGFAVETQPRAHSWLLPSASMAIPPSTLQPVDPKVAAASATLLNPGPTSVTTQPHDPLEALNRALLEQAWLRGVDLT